jgi:hypothetical protein
MPLVDDADRHQHHAGAHVEAAREQKVHIGLFELELALLFASLDERVLDFHLAHEADAIAERVGDQQHEAVEIERAVGELGLVVMEVHVAREIRPWRARGRRRGWLWRVLRPRRERREQEQQRRSRHLHEQLRCGAGADGDQRVVFAAHAHAVGGGVALLDLNRGARLEVMAIDEAQERAVLIHDARHPHRRADRARHESLRLLRLHLPVGVGDRVAVRIDLWTPQHRPSGRPIETTLSCSASSCTSSQA